MPSPRLLDALAAHSQRRSDDVALVFGERSLTYGLLHEAARSSAAELKALGLPPDQPLCVPANNTPETIALLAGAFQSGYSVLVPSPELGADSLNMLCAQARCSTILTAAESGGTGRITALPVEPDTGAAEGFARVDPERTPLMLTTSGSTGVPKIVPIPAAGFDSFTDWATGYFALNSEAVALGYAPLNFDVSLLEVWAVLANGGRVVLADRASSTDARHLQDLVAGHGVTFLQGVPMLHRLLTQDEAEFAAVRTVIMTGDALPQALRKPMAAAFPGARFHNVFGCTETNDSFVHDVDMASDEEKMPIGRPLDGVKAAVVDEEGKVVEGPGTGELLVSTPFQTPGYLQDARNEGVFVPAPDGSGDVFYRTGDVVTRDADGLHVLQGRSDFQVKVRGVRTNVQEVESVLTAHPEVAEAVVVALPDPEAGHRLHAQVTRRRGTALTSLHLRTHGAKNLPRYAIPSTVAVSDTPLPRTPTGKPDRNLIKEARMKGITA